MEEQENDQEDDKEKTLDGQKADRDQEEEEEDQGGPEPEDQGSKPTKDDDEDPNKGEGGVEGAGGQGEDNPTEEHDRNPGGGDQEGNAGGGKQEKGNQEKEGGKAETEGKGQTNSGADPENFQDAMTQPEDWHGTGILGTQDDTGEMESLRQQADKWFAQKPRITAMIQFLGKKYEEYKRLTAIDNLRVIADGGKLYQDKSRTLGEVVRSFLSGWPG